MLNVNKPPVHTHYLNNNYYFDSTNSDFKLNKLDEVDEADEAIQLNVSKNDRSARSAGLKLSSSHTANASNRASAEQQPPATTQLPPTVDQLSDPDQLIDQPNKTGQASQQNELNKAPNSDDQKLKNKLGKMFKKLSNLKASKSDKKTSSSSSDKPSKSEKKKPLITVIHKTVTKNNVKLFEAAQENAENEDANCVSAKLSSDRRPAGHQVVAATAAAAHKPASQRDDSSPNQSSIPCHKKSSQSNQSSSQLNASIQFDDSNLSSLPIDPSHGTNRKIEDVRSRSESKLANCQPRKQAPTKLKSEVESHY